MPTSALADRLRYPEGRIDRHNRLDTVPIDFQGYRSLQQADRQYDAVTSSGAKQHALHASERTLNNSHSFTDLHKSAGLRRDSRAHGRLESSDFRIIDWNSHAAYTDDP